MKKFLLGLIVLSSTLAVSEGFTRSEQIQISKQFAAFQKAIKSKDIQTISNMIEYPLSNDIGSDDINEDDFKDKDSVIENKTEIIKSLKELTLPKVNSETNKITKYSKKGNAKTCDFEVNTKFTDSNDSNFFDNYGITPDKNFVVTASYFADSGADVDGCAGYNTYFFKYEDKKLKLYKEIALP